MDRFIKIGEAAQLLGVSIQTLRRWEIQGELLPDRKTAGGTRYYSIGKLLGLKINDSDVTIAYARVSSHDQKEDLLRQAKLLSSYCAAHGWNHEVIQDLGSGQVQEVIKSLLNILDTIEEEIQKLDTLVKDQGKEDERVKLLQTVDGVGPITSLAFIAEIDNPELMMIQ